MVQNVKINSYFKLKIKEEEIIVAFNLNLYEKQFNKSFY